MKKINFILVRLGDEDFATHITEALNDSAEQIIKKNLNLDEIKDLIITLIIIKSIAHAAIYHAERVINLKYITKLQTYFNHHMTVNFEKDKPDYKGASAYLDLHSNQSYLT